MHRLGHPRNHFCLFINYNKYRVIKYPISILIHFEDRINALRSLKKSRKRPVKRMEKKRARRYTRRKGATPGVKAVSSTVGNRGTKVGEAIEHLRHTFVVSRDDFRRVQDHIIVLHFQQVTSLKWSHVQCRPVLPLHQQSCFQQLSPQIIFTYTICTWKHVWDQSIPKRLYLIFKTKALQRLFLHCIFANSSTWPRNRSVFTVFTQILLCRFYI